MTTRTFYAHGTSTNDVIADITVDGKLVHSGPINGSSLFKFTTSVWKHGKVGIQIKMQQGSITVTHNRVTYPALINGKIGFVNMPQPITQPNLPFTVTDEITYDHYMFNGPMQWIISTDTSEDIVVIENFYSAIVSGFIEPDWQYDCCPVDVENLSYVSLM
jgi:hypothetical protein